MPVKLDSVVRLLNRELSIRKVLDYSRNGLQVRASSKVTRIALAADASMDAFRQAKKRGCDLIIVHHGLFWKGQRDLTGMTKRRVAFLKKGRLSLYAAHLPLDKSIRYGHNAHILRLLGARRRGVFCRVGYIGYLSNARGLDSVARSLNRELGTRCEVWRFGGRKIRSLAVVSGSGGSCMESAIKRHVDLMVTGEVAYKNYYIAKEAGLNVIMAGHYKTETSGVKAIGDLLRKKMDLETIFLDLPTGI